MRKSINRTVATVFGAIFLLIGLLGFLVTGGVDFAGTQGGSLLGFEVNPLHNIVHILIGAILLFAGRRSVADAKRANTSVGAFYLIVGIIGLFIGGTSLNILALNAADHFLHLITAIILLVVGLTQDKGYADDTVGTTGTAGTPVV